MLKPHHTVLSLTLLLALLGDSWGQSQRPSPSHRNPDRQTETQPKSSQNPPSDDKRGTEQSPVVVKVIGAEPKTQDAPHNNQESHQEKSPDWWMTLALIGVGLLQLTAFIVQAWRLGQTINVMKETAERQLRAYVSVKQFDISPMVDTETTALTGWELRLVWQNTGATPTRDMLSHVSIRFEAGEIPDDFRFPDTWVIGKKQVYVPVYLAPNSTFISGVAVFSVAQLQEVRRGQKTLHLYGWADYNDIFFDTPRRRTEFCARVILPGDPAYIGGANIAFDLHWKHNGADEECMRKPITSVKREKIPDLPAQSAQKNNNTT
jgi:hypothetical protein